MFGQPNAPSAIVGRRAASLRFVASGEFFRFIDNNEAGMIPGLKENNRAMVCN